MGNTRLLIILCLVLNKEMYLSLPVTTTPSELQEYLKIQEEEGVVNPSSQEKRLIYRFIYQIIDLKKQIQEKDDRIREAGELPNTLIDRIEALNIQIGTLQNILKNYEKPLRIISAQSKLKGLVDKLYPLGFDKDNNVTIYSKPKSGYCEALTEILKSTDQRFTQDEYVMMLRQRLKDNNITMNQFIKFSRWLYGQFSDCHIMSQFAPPLPDFDDTEGIEDMLKAVEIDVDAPVVKCMKVMLQPLD